MQAIQLLRITVMSLTTYWPFRQPLLPGNG